MRILVTGGAGFIGSHLTERLVVEGHKVRVLDNLSSGRREHLSAVFDQIECVVGDVRDRGDVSFALRERDAVVHLAAIASVPASLLDPVGTHETNFDGTLVLLDAARRQGLGRFVYASSAAVYGDSVLPPVREDEPPEPGSPYAADKLAGEYFLRFYARRYGIRAVALRFFNVYGPRQDPGSSYSGVISRFLYAAAHNQPLTLFGDGRQTRDFVWVADVAGCLARMVSASVDAFTLMNVGTGRESSLLDLINIMEDRLGRGLERRIESARPDDIQRSCADTARLRHSGISCDTGLDSGLGRLMRIAGIERVPAGSVKRGGQKRSIALHDLALVAKEIEDREDCPASGVITKRAIPARDLE
ncbi:MAG: NAD-dependent epimerase/dehydratase family protein [Acidiferrobacteraceae bacterium]